MLMRRVSLAAVALTLGLAAFAAAPERKAAPDFSLKDQKGKPHALKDLKGKVVVLDFGRVICIPCRAVMDDLNVLHSAYANKGVAIYSVNLGVDPGAVQDYVNQKKLKFPFLEDPGYKVTSSYGVRTIPYLVLIDKKGRIYKTQVGHSQDFRKQMEADLKKLLAEK